MSWLRPVYREEPAPAQSPIAWDRTTERGVSATTERSAVWAWPIPEPEEEEEDAELVEWLVGTVSVLAVVVVVFVGVWLWRRITGCPM